MNDRITVIQSAQISQKQGERNMYAIMKTMCPPRYRQITYNGFVAMMYSYTNVLLA